MTLAEEIVAYLVEHGEATYLEVARGIGRRNVAVLDLLRDDERFAGPFTREGDGRLIYRLAPAREPEKRRERRSRSGRRTHCDRVLDLLGDGAWHSHLEGYRLGVMLHSRVSDLRQRGYRIETRRDGDLYLYRLVATPTTAGDSYGSVEPGVAPEPSPQGASPAVIGGAAPTLFGEAA